jgi:hypothetical protein
VQHTPISRPTGSAPPTLARWQDPGSIVGQIRKVTTPTRASAITATIPRPMIARSTLLEQSHVNGRMHGWRVNVPGQRLWLGKCFQQPPCRKPLEPGHRSVRYVQHESYSERARSASCTDIRIETNMDPACGTMSSVPIRSSAVCRAPLILAPRCCTTLPTAAESGSEESEPQEAGTGTERVVCK